jgi:hypothetical protein
MRTHSTLLLRSKQKKTDDPNVGASATFVPARNVRAVSCLFNFTIIHERRYGFFTTG